MDKFVAFVFCVTVGFCAQPFSIELAGYSPTRETGRAEKPCPSKCKGDFPERSNRRYAQAGDVFHWS
jgi:hypothetical protein